MQHPATAPRNHTTLRQHPPDEEPLDDEASLSAGCGRLCWNGEKLVEPRARRCRPEAWLEASSAAAR